MTLSIVARCAASGRFGVAIASSSPAVAARCAFARAGVGAAASQNVTDPSLGPRLLDRMAAGAAAADAIGALVAAADHIQYRQLTAVDAAGRSAVFSGARSLGIHAACHARDAACAGNLLDNDSVPRAMLERFGKSKGDLGERLLLALAAGMAAGGEAGEVRSAGLLMVDSVSWPVADLRVDWDDDPVRRLGTLWSVYAPQLADYVTRALDPAAAPVYGVPGDE